MYRVAIELSGVHKVAIGLSGVGCHRVHRVVRCIWLP